jgi:tetratricopeptide (TPR) repeat protein
MNQNEIERSEFGQLLRKVRRQSQDPDFRGMLSQKRLAELLEFQAKLPGYTHVRIANWERGLPKGEVIRQDNRKLLVGGIHMRRGVWEEALICYEKAKQSFSQSGDKHKLAVTLNNLGVVYAHLEQPALSQTVLAEAVQLYVHLQDARGEAQTRRNLTALHKSLKK